MTPGVLTCDPDPAIPESLSRGNGISDTEPVFYCVRSIFICTGTPALIFTSMVKTYMVYIDYSSHSESLLTEINTGHLSLVNISHVTEYDTHTHTQIRLQ